MKNTKKLLGIMLVSMLALSAFVMNVAAAKYGDAYSVYGVGLGWVLIIIVIAIALIAWGMQITKAAMKPVIPILAIVFIAGLVLQGVDVAVEPAEITPSVTWDVTCASGTSDTTIDNSARTITKLIGTFAAGTVINGTDDNAWDDNEDDLWLNFTISPSIALGVTETTNQATTNCIVNNPTQTFTEDGTAYDLFEDVSSLSDKSLTWTTDGTTAYEDKYCTVTIGGSETAAVYIDLLDDGLCIREAGESNTFTIGIGGITYTVTVIVTILHVG